MRRNRWFSGFAILATMLAAACAGVDDGSLPNDDTAQDRDRANAELVTIQIQPHAAVCSGGRWSCTARVRTDSSSKIKSFATPSGLGPSDLVSAYKLDTTKGSGAIVAIVDAFNYPNAESDLASYRSQYGLPPCTKANGCFKVVNQNGATSPLPGNS